MTTYSRLTERTTDGTGWQLPTGPVSLDNRHQKCTHPTFTAWCGSCRAAKRRRNRCFQRVMSGLRIGGQLKFVTLTTSPEAWQAGKSIQASFRALIMRLRRRSLCFGYVRVVEFTRAGLPHYHVILRGPFIPQTWLSTVWKDIHLSPIVDVRGVRLKGGVAGYLAKYLGKDTRARYSWSWDWVWRGFAKSWRELVAEGLAGGASILDIVEVWGVILDGYRARHAETFGVG